VRSLRSGRSSRVSARRKGANFSTLRLVAECRPRANDSLPSMQADAPIDSALGGTRVDADTRLSNVRTNDAHTQKRVRSRATQADDEAPSPKRRPPHAADESAPLQLDAHVATTDQAMLSHAATHAHDECSHAAAASSASQPAYVRAPTPAAPSHLIAAVLPSLIRIPLCEQECSQYWPQLIRPITRASLCPRPKGWNATVDLYPKVRPRVTWIFSRAAMQLNPRTYIDDPYQLNRIGTDSIIASAAKKWEARWRDGTRIRPDGNRDDRELVIHEVNSVPFLLNTLYKMYFQICVQEVRMIEMLCEDTLAEEEKALLNLADMRVLVIPSVLYFHRSKTFSEW
jgi:hypothetical protein